MAKTSTMNFPKNCTRLRKCIIYNESPSLKISTSENANKPNPVAAAIPRVRDNASEPSWKINMSQTISQNDSRNLSFAFWSHSWKYRMCIHWWINFNWKEKARFVLVSVVRWGIIFIIFDKRYVTNVVFGLLEWNAQCLGILILKSGSFNKITECN